MATFEKITEEPSHYDHLEQMSVHEILTHINEEDHRVADAVQQAIPQIEDLVKKIVPYEARWPPVLYRSGNQWPSGGARCL